MMMDRPVWRLEGWDTFASETYPLRGTFATEEEALAAAQKHLREIDRLQPTSTADGPDGPQDRVFLIRPTGERQRIRRTS